MKATEKSLQDSNSNAGGISERQRQYVFQLIVKKNFNRFSE